MRLALAAILALAACSKGVTTPQVDFTADPIVVFNDRGGNPYEYAALWERLEATGKPVQVGECNSACTMFLSLSRACMMPGRRFGFHASSGLVSDAWIAEYLPGRIGEMYLSTWSKSRDFTKLTSEQIKDIEPSLEICR